MFGHYIIYISMFKCVYQNKTTVTVTVNILCSPSDVTSVTLTLTFINFVKRRRLAFTQCFKCR